MNRCILSFWAFLFLVMGAMGQPPGEEYRLEIIGGVDASRFPEVAVKFRILDKQGEPAKELPQTDIVIYEDGKEVHRIKPKILREVPGSAMLVLDTSGSMARLEKMTEAQRAARIFCERLDPKTACGLVLFHHEPYERIAPSTKREAVLKAVSESEATGGTACFDAVKTALEMLGEQDKGPQRQAIVVMTDGRDVNSRTKLDELIQLAKVRETAVHTIGLGEAGKQQPVRTILVLDRSGSMADQGKIVSLRKAALRYVDLLPDQGAEATVIAFNHRIPPAEEFTNDKARLRRQLQSIQPQGDTALYDAIWEALETLNAAQSSMEGKTPSQSLIVLTDGLDNHSRHRPEDVAERAKEDKVRLFTLGLGSGREIDARVLGALADATGGRFFHVQSPDKLTDVFEELSIELHDDGIDEQALQRLAAATGGHYHHVREVDQLRTAFEQLAATVDNTHSVKFTSQRARHDGTARGIEIKLGSLAAVQSGYATHGLLTPQSSTGLYLLGLAVLGALFLVPMLVRQAAK
jgi:VWFA-related protein